MARFCSNCGTPLQEGAAFCTECGNKIEVKPQQVLPAEEIASEQLNQQNKPAEDIGSFFEKEHSEAEHYIDDNGIKETFFRYDNRLNRWRYFKRNCVLGLSGLCIFTALFEIAGITLPDAGVPMIVFFTMLPLQIRRWHDLGKSGWWCITALIPVVGAFAALYLTFASGDYGPNEYGPDPLEGRRKLL